MRQSPIRKFLALDLEEKILNGASLVAVICIFFPWVGGEWLGGKTITYNGLGFFTSFIGVSILLLHFYVLLITFIPLTGGPQIVSKQNRHIARLVAAGLAAILCIAIWSVLTKFTFEFSRLQIYFGLYGTLIGSLVAALYALLQSQDGKRKEVERLFRHGEANDSDIPPPPTHEPEEHRMR